MKLGYMYGGKVKGSVRLGTDPYTAYAAEFQKQIILESDDDLDLLEQNINEQSATLTYPLGTRLHVGERTFRYAHLSASIDASNTFRGRILGTSDAGVERGAFLGAQVAAAKTVNWTTVGIVTLNQFADGYLLTQGGFVHKIKSNTADPVGGAVIVLTLYEAFAACEAIAAGRYGLLLENPYANLRGHSVAGSCREMGAILADYTADYYVWIQTWGPCGIIATPATMGDAMNEIEMCKNQAGEEVSRRLGVGAAVASGYQTVGHSWVGGGGINWENENFIHIWLMIDP